MFEAQWGKGERRTDKGIKPVRQSAPKVQHGVNDFKHVRSVSIYIFFYSWAIKGVREQSKHSHLGDGWSTQRETTPRNTAKEQSIRSRKSASGLFYLNRRNINCTEGLIAMCVGVIMNPPARSALSPPRWVESCASHVIGQKSREPAEVPVLSLSPAQSCLVSPVRCGLAPALHSLSSHCVWSWLLSFPTHSIGYLWIRFCLSFSLRLQASWRSLCLCTFLQCLGLKSLHVAGIQRICLLKHTPIFVGWLISRACGYIFVVVGTMSRNSACTALLEADG